MSATGLAVFSMVLAYAALVAAYLALRSNARLRREGSARTGSHGSGERHRRDDPSALRNIALVRYDAFGEMSGQTSFSLAMLNDRGDGITISAIAGRSSTSVYAKGVTSGKGEHDLSPEEEQAVSSALRKPRHSLTKRRPVAGQARKAG
jgi:hypothetical protein